MSLLTVRNLSAGYGKRRVIGGISFSLERGTVMGVLGANGCGKTTLLRAICGALPHEGECALEGEALERMSVRRLAQRVSYIPQRSGISIDVSALDVVLMGFNPRLPLLARPTAAMREQAARALARVGLAGREEENYLNLSEGQKQLCILARTLVSSARLLLLDEPESALDFRYRHDMLALIRDAAAKDGRSALVALHDPQLALNACDRLLLLGEGGAAQVLSPAQDADKTLERALSRLYGPVSLHRVKGRAGRTQLIMLKEDLP